MKPKAHILLVLILLFAGSNIAMAQVEEYNSALKFAESGNWDSAKVHIDRFVSLPEGQKDAEGWYLRGYVYARMYKKYEDQNNYSKYRTEAVNSALKSIELDPSRQNRDANRPVFCSLAAGFYNSAVKTLDTNNYKVAIDNYNMYRSVVPYCDSTVVLKDKDVDFYLALGTIFQDKLDSCRCDDSLFFDRARDAFMKVLSIDPKNVKANYDLGILYHNHAVHLIMSLTGDEDIIKIIDRQEQAGNNFQRALPFGEFGLNLPDNDPKKLDYLVLLYEIHRGLNNDAMKDKIQLMIDDLKKKSGH